MIPCSSRSTTLGRRTVAAIIASGSTLAGAAFAWAAGTSAGQRTETVLVSPTARHPYMGRYANSMHEDAFASDTTPYVGPTRPTAKFQYFQVGGVTHKGICPTFVFDSKGRVITIKMQMRDVDLLRIDPQTLKVLARKDLPTYSFRKKVKRVFKFMRDPGSAFESTPAGPYLFMDHQDRVVVPTLNDQIQVFALTPDGTRFVDVQTIKMRRDRTRRPEGIPADDELESVMPDWKNAGLYWFATGGGIVGFVNTRDETVRSTRVDTGESIRNSFPVGPDGAFVLTDRALYRFEIESPSQRPKRRWREPYPTLVEEKDLKKGQLGPGSGTTPTVFGDFVTIGDCGDRSPGDTRMKVRIHRRDSGQLVAAHPVFPRGVSHGENSFIAYGNSIVICNTFGYRSPFDDNKQKRGGLVRIDVDPRTGRCTEVWNEPTPHWTTTPKLSTAGRIIYSYAYLPDAGYWAVVGYRYDTGKEAFRILVSKPDPEGISRVDRFDNSWGVVFLSPPRSGPPMLFIGAIEGFLRIIDQP